MKPHNYLKPLTSKCKENKCAHKKCSCGHCSQYHFARDGECCKINFDLSTCLCKQFKNEDEEDIMDGKTPSIHYKPNQKEVTKLAIEAIKKGKKSKYKLVYDKTKKTITGKEVE